MQSKCVSRLTWWLLLHYLAKLKTRTVHPFQWNTVHCFTNTQKNDYVLVTVEPPFICKTIDFTICTKQDLGRAHSIHFRTSSVFTKSHGVGCCSPCRKWEFFFIKPGVEPNQQYYWDILTSRQMLAAVKHIADDNFVLAKRRFLHATVQLLQRENVNFLLSYGSSNSPELKLIELITVIQ